MIISRYNQKSNQKCSVCDNKSNKEFEIISIETGMEENVFHICFSCQKKNKLTNLDKNYTNSKTKFYIS